MPGRGVAVKSRKVVTRLANEPVRSMAIRIRVAVVPAICHVRGFLAGDFAKSGIEHHKGTALTACIPERTENLLLLGVQLRSPTGRREQYNDERSDDEADDW